ncbi:hypothetical protein DL769_006473 [Monosporascus sp. CRB-8-3]|nr:hypothetical protein DL769_006473 [Monosporascus sp. CRB-8-3]
MDQASSHKCIGLIPAVVDSARGALAQVASAFAGVDHFLILVVFAVLLYVGLVVEMLRTVRNTGETEGVDEMDETALLKAALGRRRRLDCIV